MYSRDKKVKIPQSGKKGTIHIIKSGYVYLAVTYKWDSENRKPIEKRVTIGIRTEDNVSMMYPNPNYYQYFGTAEEKIANQPKKPKVNSLKRKEAGPIDSHISVGLYYVLKEASKRTGCFDALTQVFSTSDADLILALAIHAIATPNSSVQDFSSWCFDNYCGLAHVVSDSEINRLYAKLGSDQDLIESFLKCYSENFIKKIASAPKRVIAIDPSKQNVYSLDQDQSSCAKVKINLALPTINTALFLDEDTGIPVWFEHYDGSLDKIKTPYLLKTISNLGYKKFMAIFDHDYYSETKIQELRAIDGYDFGMLCLHNDKLLDAIIDEHGEEIKERQSYYIADENIYGACFKIENFGAKSFAYLFYRKSQANDEHTVIHQNLRYYWNKALQQKHYSDDMAQEFNAFNIIVNKISHIDEEGRDFQLVEDINGIQKLLDRAGFFVMLSDLELTPAEAIKLARQKECVEQCFEKFKRHFDLSISSTHSMETYYGKVFIAFIASIIYASIKHDVKEILASSTSITMECLMAELNKYKAELSIKGNWRPVYTMSKLQQEILQAVDLTEQKLYKEIEELKLLE